MSCINSLYEHKNKAFYHQYIEKHSFILFHILSCVFENDTNICFYQPRYHRLRRCVPKYQTNSVYIFPFDNNILFFMLILC